MEQVDITIIGAGVVGLAVARQVADSSRSVVLLEKHPSFGQETSSRNSEVIHAGIYYPAGSLKAQLCVTGNPLLYAFCQKHQVPHKRLGKIIVATQENELAHLEKLYQIGRENGAPGLEFLDAQQVKKMEPEIKSIRGLLSPNTGIVDSHVLMSKLEAQARALGALITYDAEVTGIEKITSGYRITIKKESYQFESRMIVNCAGLSADRVAALAGLDCEQTGYKLYYCRGDYFRTSRPLNIQRLIYPVPPQDVRGLGIHLTKDLAGGTRFGPDVTYVEQPEYQVDADKQAAFCEAIQRYIPAIEPKDIYPDMAGVRPKLQGPGDGFRDFVIREESDRGLPGLINLIGIESPGLTSSLALGDYVNKMIGQVNSHASV